ncbi:MAG: hypothetical protein ACK41V_00035 [Acidovorax sp.]|uniref:hypothetical protein n=1 Tax=Acidovorax sp. TaxID=1872122 RepID=UPI00391A5C87
MTQYRFVSNGGCARCEAMEGIYASPPERPHPFCRCTIETVGEDGKNTDLSAPTNGQPGNWDRTGPSWAWERDGSFSSEDNNGDSYAETYLMDGFLFVTCCDGSSTGEPHRLEVTVDLRQGDSREAQDALLEVALQDAESELAQRALELYEQDCEPCNPRVS